MVIGTPFWMMTVRVVPETPVALPDAGRGWSICSQYPPFVAGLPVNLRPHGLFPAA
jgi:hypothetical protein